MSVVGYQLLVISLVFAPGAVVNRYSKNFSLKLTRNNSLVARVHAV